ncbi:MAG: ferritin-like domain-containing protein [Armatimonadetes bacterium]|nr:ferritin-like domain-containing protein [Armatimonadota bacterium]
MKIRLAQNTPAMDNATPGTMNGTMMGNMPNAMSGGMTTEARMNMMGLGPMIAAPNLNSPVEQFGATQASMMRASGGPIPGLREAKPKTSAQGITNDVAILNSALLLEHLEAEFYARVVAADQARSFLQGRQKVAAVTLARDEAAHVINVTEMITKLGGAPIEKPQFQFPANVFLSPIAFLQVSVELEENGVGAYLGAAPMVANKDVLNFAASIYGIEARHTGWIRFLLGDQIAPRPLEQPRTIEEAVANAAPFIVKDSVMPAGTGTG